uniref:Uncharacterized protein n=1 Tax=Amazona collaria TaxID=241587 RepID=A0A8B9F9C3_9PSIT
MAGLRYPQQSGYCRAAAAMNLLLGVFHVLLPSPSPPRLHPPRALFLPLPRCASLPSPRFVCLPPFFNECSSAR